METATPQTAAPETASPVLYKGLFYTVTESGVMVDVYQATTQLTDESGQNLGLHTDTRDLTRHVMECHQALADSEWKRRSKSAL